MQLQLTFIKLSYGRVKKYDEYHSFNVKDLIVSHNEVQSFFNVFRSRP